MLTSLEFNFVRSLIREASGIAIEDDKLYLVKSRLSRVVRKSNLPSIGGLIRQLRSTPFGPLHRRVVEAMTTNETSFFRDRPTFDLLHTDVLPDLIAKRAAERTIRIWSAACSSGQEPYSIVMTLDQHFPLLATWNVEILATDISNRMIERAKAGEYSQAEVNRGLPAKLLVRYFNQDGTTWLLKRRIRDRVTYSGHNLTNGTPPQVSWDIVFLRNVMIYFGTETKRAILRKIRRVLRPDGYLFLGGAETTLNVADGFERLSASCFRIRAESTSDRNTALSRAAAPTT